MGLAETRPFTIVLVSPIRVLLKTVTTYLIFSLYSTMKPRLILVIQIWYPLKIEVFTCDWYHLYFYCSLWVTSAFLAFLPGLKPHHFKFWKALTSLYLERTIKYLCGLSWSQLKRNVWHQNCFNSRKVSGFCLLLQMVSPEATFIKERRI